MIASKQKGLNLIEMMIVLSIAMILMVIAVPSYRAFIQNNRSVAFSSDFVRSLEYARSEAISRSATVTMCAAANSRLNSCGNNTQWINGWLIFTDAAGNGVYNSTTDTLLTVHDAILGQGMITAPAATMVFNSSGFLNSGGGNFQFKVTGCHGNYGRDINLSNSGRLSVVWAVC